MKILHPIVHMLQGEYVSPEKIEYLYEQSQFIAQAFVHGDLLKVNNTFAY